MASYRLEAKRRKALDDSIRSAQQRHDTLELLVRAAEGKQETLARELERLGSVNHVYAYIPYVSFLCSAEDAATLRTSLRGSGSKALKKLISAIDVSNSVTLPRILHAGKRTGVWNLEQIGAYEAQEYGDGSGVKVGIMDTGVHYAHAELRDNFSSDKGHAFVGSDPRDDNGHGTHVAGIVAGATYGVAPGAQLYSLKVLNSEGAGSEAHSIAAVEWAVQHGLDVVNMSLGSPVASRAFEEICYYAAAQGMYLVAAAGNEGSGPSYPAAFDDAVIAVAAVDSENRHAYFSNIYETNDVSAPGVDVTSAYRDGYETLSGTSMASPHVAGTLALAISLNGRADVEDTLMQTAERLGAEDVFGAGLVRADRMAQAIGRMATTNRSRQLLERVMNIVW